MNNKIADSIIKNYINNKKEIMKEQLTEAIEKLIKEKEKYKYLYQKALDNTIKSDRELIKFKNAIKEIKEKAEIETFIQNKIKELENMLKETMKGNLQRYTPLEIILLKGFLQELLEERR